jgi:hypothetical protein
LESEKLAAIRTFKGGAVMLACGAAAAAATFFMSISFLSGLSAALTILGGAIAAGATERYRRAQ